MGELSSTCVPDCIVFQILNISRLRPLLLLSTAPTDLALAWMLLAAVIAIGM